MNFHLMCGVNFPSFSAVCQLLMKDEAIRPSKLRTTKQGKRGTIEQSAERGHFTSSLGQSKTATDCISMRDNIGYQLMGMVTGNGN